MEVSILGTLELRRDGDAVPVSGARVRALVARLALDAGRDGSPAVLIAAVWDDSPRGDASHALQALVSRLRRVLHPGGELVSGTAGYRLQVDAEAVDALRFEKLAASGAAALRDGDPGRAAVILRDALALWRGPALGELAGTQRFATAAAGPPPDLRPPAPRAPPRRPAAASTICASRRPPTGSRPSSPSARAASWSPSSTR